MNDDLLRSWAITASHLERARSLLPAVLREFPDVEEGSVRHYEEYLAHNELEFALDELVGLGSHNQFPDDYWVALIAAADNMGLLERAAELRSQLEVSDPGTR